MNKCLFIFRSVELISCGGADFISDRFDQMPAASFGHSRFSANRPTAATAAASMMPNFCEDNPSDNMMLFNRPYNTNTAGAGGGGGGSSSLVGAGRLASLTAASGRGLE